MDIRRKKTGSLIASSSEDTLLMDTLARSLKVRIIKTKHDLQVELKSQQKRERKADQVAMKETNQYHAGAIVVVPSYKLATEFNIYQEIDKPPESLYMAVGYNNLLTVRKIMEGNDLEKRNAASPDENQSQGSFLYRQQ